MSQIDELRRILVGENAAHLSELKERIENVEQRTRDVAQVLPPAIDAGLKQDHRLVDALKAPVSQGLKEAIRTEPTAYAEILYPVMAPSIRRAIAQSISSLMVTINRTVESATSVSGLRMRIQSWRTGIPYAELALRKSLLYRVDHVFLIDRDSGLLVAEVASEDAQSLDSDAISAMFSAIQSFVQDSFSRDQSARLTDLKVGEHNVWVAHGSKMMLACVIFGDAPESLKTELYDALDGIHTEFATQVENFRGDSSAFVGLQAHIQPLLQLQLKEGEDDSDAAQAKSQLPIVLAIVAAFACAAYWLDRNVSLATVEHHFRQTPGVAVIDVYWQGRDIVVEGLRDPDASLPFDTLAAYGIEPASLKLKTQPFRSLEPAMELQRFSQEFSLPNNVRLLENVDHISISGAAPITWLDENYARLRQLAEDGRLNIQQLRPSEPSVRSLLLGEFSAQELQALTLSADRYAGQSVIDIGGFASPSVLARLDSLFAGSHWIALSATAAPLVSAPQNATAEPADY